MRLRKTILFACLCGNAQGLNLRSRHLGRAALTLLTCIALLPANLSAQSLQAGVDAPLTLEQCIDLALKAPSTVKAAHEQLEAARHAQQSAAASFLPQVSIVNGFTYNSPLLYERNAFSFVALNGIREYATAANATLDVDTSGKIKAAYDRTKAERHAQEANAVIAERNMRASVTAAYYRLLLTRKLASAADENARIASDFSSKVQKLLNGGEASRADLSRAITESASLQRTASLTHTAAANANHELASYWTLDVTPEISIVDDLEQRLVAPTILDSDRGFLQRPELNLARAQIDIRRADAHVARAGVLPQLNLNFQYGFDTNHLVSENRGYAGFVHFDVPVFDFFHAYNAKRSFDEQAHAAQTSATILERQLSRAYQDALSQANGVYAALAPTETELKAAEESLRLSRERFDGGEGSALDVVTAENAFVQAQIDFYSTRADFLNAQTALKVASGK